MKISLGFIDPEDVGYMVWFGSPNQTPVIVKRGHSWLLDVTDDGEVSVTINEAHRAHAW